MTLIELVAALSLFVIILGSLLIIMNSATALWTSSRSQQRELPVAQHIIELLAEDLQQAVTDNGSVSNSTANTATFILDSRPVQLGPNEVSIPLSFIRQAATPSRPDTGTGIPLSLDAVFYTVYGNALFRHVVPLSYTSFTRPETLGELLDQAQQKINVPGLHQAVMAFSTKGTVDPASLPAWSCTLLAERIGSFSLIAALPKSYEKNDWGRVKDETSTGNGLTQPPDYDALETRVLPDRVDVAIELFSEESWNNLQRAFGRNDTSEAERIQDQFGIRVSQRITFPAQGASRLP